MERVALTTSQINYLANKDPILAPFFCGALASDELPSNPKRGKPKGYVVNTEPRNKSGHHWIAIWTENNVCEIMDSFALPLDHYKLDATPLAEWVNRHWKYVVTNGQALQALPNQTCGHYALFYLKTKARGHSLQDFLSMFSKHDYVANDHKVGRMLKHLIVDDLEWKHCKHECDQVCQ